MDPYGFLGSGLKFPLQIDPKTGHLAIASHEENILESVGIIVNTTKGERIMRDTFGCEVSEYLFDSATAMNVQNLTVHLTEEITKQEPRVRDVEVSVLEEEAASYTGKLRIQVEYTVRSTNNRYNHVYPYYMDEGNREESII